MTSDTYVAIIATSFTLITHGITIFFNWPIPGRGHVTGDYYSILNMVSAPFAFLVSAIAVIRAIRAKENQNINLGIASISLLLAFCLLTMYT